MRISSWLPLFPATAILFSISAYAEELESNENPSTAVVPLAEGGLDKALTNLPETITDILERSGVPGMAVAVVHGDDVVFIDGYGVRKLGEDAPVTPETVFQIASVSKSISATVAAIAVSKGEVSWDDRVKDHLPAFALSEPYVTANATIGDFFSHRSGLPDAAGDELEDLGYSRAETIERLKLVPLDRFRISYHYANFGLTIGAEAVAAATGMDWERLAAAYLYEPLGMNSTSSRYADFLARPNAAALHTWVDGKFEALYQRDPDQQSPAGGVSSNVQDLALWLKLLLSDPVDGGLIEKSAILPALQPQAVSKPGANADARTGFYGYGFNVDVSASGRPYMGHSGAFLLGASTHFRIFPDEKLGIVVLSNGAPVGAAEAVVAHFMDVVQFGAPSRDWLTAYGDAFKALYDPIGGLAGQPWPSDAAPPANLENYAGDYDNGYFGKALIEADEQGLAILLGPKREKYELRHWSGDVFALTPRGENAPVGSRCAVAFDMQAERGAGFTIDCFNEDGLGTWERSAS